MLDGKIPMSYDVAIKSISCDIARNVTRMEVEITEKIGDTGMSRVRERLQVSVSGKYRSLDNEALEAAKAKITEYEDALGLKG